MLQNYSTINNHTFVSEKNYKLIINHLKCSTLKIKNPILHERGEAGIAPSLPPPPAGSIKYFKICKGFELETS